ncbi:MAG: ATP-dependent Clp protease ATP-binding subunit ClpA [Bdellovibrionales bacterium]|nr:ATP-dependent Clp protease ATP-binding subunit ClpA [Bdellovibrionales bacterium]
MSMVSKQTEAVLNRAIRIAVDHSHEYFTLEHVLLSLLEESEIRSLVEACGANPDLLAKDLKDALEKDVPKIANGEHPVATLDIQKLIQRALFHVQSAGKSEITPSDLLVALYQFKDSQAFYLLSKHEIERLDLLSVISHGGIGDEEASVSGGEEESAGADGGSDHRGADGESQDPLKAYTQDLNEKAAAGKIDPLIGRQLELDRMVQTLCRRRKNNPILVGEAGVGKTALAEGLALRIHQGNVPDVLKSSRVYALDLGLLIAGAKFRGDFEQRLKRVLKALENRKKAPRSEDPILFIDEIHTIIGAGAVSGGVLDAANLLKPLLTSGELKCVGSTTYAEYRNVFEKDHALARRFQKIDVPEPTQEEAIQILEGLKPGFEAHHGVTYTSAALKSAVELSVKHLTDRHLPDKAIDLLDEAGAKMKLSRAKATDASAGTVGKIDQVQIEELVAQIARIPQRSVSSQQKNRLKDLEKELKMVIFGQDTAIETLVTAIHLARSGLRTGERPVGSFLFCGPTGVGKTELSKQLALSLGVPFVRFDMSEYGERHTVSRLIGAPPGYVGFEQSGLLTEAVLKNPHVVVLLDEIEKAHPEVWNILLQVMDHGFLTDNNGRKADFRNAIVLMTSNVGSREMERRPIGVLSDDKSESLASAKKAVETTFTPEFRNRLDAVVYFNPLDPTTITQVVSKQLMELESQLLAKRVELEVDEEVRAWLAREGYDQRMGARPMARLIQDRIKKGLAQEILFGSLEKGGKVRVQIADGKPVFHFSPRAGRGGAGAGGASGGSSKKKKSSAVTVKR